MDVAGPIPEELWSLVYISNLYGFVIFLQSNTCILLPLATLNKHCIGKHSIFHLFLSFWQEPKSEFLDWFSVSWHWKSDPDAVDVRH